MHRFLSIIGPTATGKTQFALEVAKQLADSFSHFDIISADSRQIFQEMEIGTGRDLPAQFTRLIDAAFSQPFFESENCRLHGLGILKPDQAWSVSQFQTFSQQIMRQSWQSDSLPIIVGGTGFYRHQLFQEDRQLFVPPNESVRQKAAELSLLELQDWLRQLSPAKFQAMNHSDQHNPRRLVRAVEIAVADSKNSPSENPATSDQELSANWQTLSIGLTDALEHIEQKIRQRVIARVKEGIIPEVQALIKKYSDEQWQHLPAFSATGYKEVRMFLEEKISHQQMLELWTRREIQYAKRQLTWFKKYATDAEWFWVDQADWQMRALQQIQSWLE